VHLLPTVGDGEGGEEVGEERGGAVHQQQHHEVDGAASHLEVAPKYLLLLPVKPLLVQVFQIWLVTAIVKELHC
jgi:hypothetical protein